MSRTHKIQRSRQVRQPSKMARVEFSRVIEEARHDHQFPTPQDYDEAREASHQVMLDAGQDPNMGVTDDSWRTSGVRYGNQRKMRARCDLQERRSDRKRDPDPILDADGDLELPSRPESPARRRGSRWTR